MTKARVACFMMQKNEDALIEPWLAYHSDLFGPQHIYLIDNGSTSEACLRVLSDYKARGVNVVMDYSSPEHYRAKGEIASGFARDMQARAGYDLIVPLDCDEFLFRYVNGAPVADANIVRAHFDELLDATTNIRIAGQVANRIGRPGWFAAEEVSKTVLRLNGTFHGTDAGYHNATSSQGMVYHPSQLGYIHFHYKPLAMLRAHARARLSPFVDVDDPATLAAYDGPIAYAKHYVTMTEEAYRGWQSDVQGERIPSFEASLARVGQKLPF